VTFEVRRAGLADVDEIAAAHVDSILSVGPRYYDAPTVQAWAAGLTGELYANAMAGGEVFFVALSQPDPAESTPAPVLGFSSHHVHGGVHGTAVYVRGSAARRGVGTALLRAAEASARATGATSIEIDASLAAVDFYKAHGFEETGRGEHRLRRGEPMKCVFMRKDLTAPRRSG
jgi:putative acetyltransferase